ncbi:MAG: hypothetical protein ACT4NY_09645 [Pseudonocardiales bacterium]
MTQRPQHADLRNLLLWIDRIKSDYEKVHPREWDNQDHKKNLESVKRILEGTSTGSAKGELRGLIATGVIHYMNSPQEIPREALPEILMLNFIVDALWPIVIAPNYPWSWHDALTN